MSSLLCNKTRSLAVALLALVLMLVTFEGWAKASNGKSTTPATTELTKGVAITGIGGSQGSMRYFSITVPSGATNLKFTTSGGSGGDVDIFAKFNVMPTVSAYDAKSDGSTRSETITISAPQAGTYYLLMYGAWSTYSGVSLVATYDTAPVTPPAPTVVTLTKGVAVNNIGGAQGSMQYFSIAVPAGASNLKFTTSGGSGGDVDIFAKFNAQPTVSAYDAKSDGSTRVETITIGAPQAGTYYVLMYGAWSTYAGVSLMATYDTAVASPPPACYLASSTVTPAIATQAAWDAKYDAQYGSTLPNLTGGAEAFAWQGHYWVRAFVSMALTYGDTKYLDRAAAMIDHWFANQETAQGWGASINPAQMFLDTGVIAQAVTIFSYQVWKDPRFINYRPKADAYLSKIEAIMRTYDPQWVNAAPYPGSPNFYIYATCGGLCSAASLVMYNQGATMAKAWLMIDRTYRLRGQTPDAAMLHKASSAAAYYKMFARINGSAALWDYGGSRTNTGLEDTSHGHLDLSLLVSARNFGIGGLTDTDMTYLAGTMQKVLSGAAGPNDVSTVVDGTGLPASNWDRVSIGYDWIELSDYDPTLFDKTVKVFNTYMSNPTASRFYLGWAEIQRKKACVAM